jgi:peptide/nickel transport system substrate-binding protein
MAAVLLLLASLCFALILPTGSLPAAARETLTIGIGQFPATLHPGTDSMLAKTYVLGLTRRPLTVHGPDWRLTCMLCTSLPTLQNGGAVTEKTPDGADGIAVTYNLRADAFWGNGVPVTSRDLAFAWAVGREPRSGVVPAEFYRRLYRLDVIDDKRVTLHFDRVAFDYNAVNQFLPLPAHLEEAAFARPEAYRQQSLYVADPTHPGLYDGPYRIEAVASGSHIRFARNPFWQGPRPAFDRIVVRAIENTAALEANLLSGAIDMIAGELGLTLDQAVGFEARHGSRFQVLFQPGLVYEHIDLNLDNPILADRRVRQALLFAIDREAISRSLFGGRQPVATGPLSPLDRMHSAEVRGYGFDPGRARALLDEAGWRTTADGGIRRNLAGELLALEFMTTAGDRTREMVQQALQSFWRQVGIEVRIRNQPARVFFGETVSQRRFTGLAMFAWISAPDSVPRSVLHSTEIPDAGNGWAGQNYAGFRNGEADRLIDAIEVELDEARRRALWQRLLAIYADELPALPLYFRANPFILPPWLADLTPTGHQAPTTLWVEQWRVR